MATFPHRHGTTVHGRTTDRKATVRSATTGRFVNEIAVRRAAGSDAETAYLLGTASNADHLRRALKQMEKGETREQ